MTPALKTIAVGLLIAPCLLAPALVRAQDNSTLSNVPQGYLTAHDAALMPLMGRPLRVHLSQ